MRLEWALEQDRGQGLGPTPRVCYLFHSLEVNKKTKEASFYSLGRNAGEGVTQTKVVTSYSKD